MGSYFDSWTDFTPAGLGGNIYSSVTGNANPVDQLWQRVQGNPDAIKEAYDKAMGTANEQGGRIKDFLLGQQAKAQGFYAPMQRMFSGMYGSGGIQAPMTPGVPGSQPLGQRPGGPNPQMQAMFGMAPMPGAGGRR